ncbi:hypothetical protein D9615_000898 [Tricholomella constricta]|uniref:C3H1-type domain-containing protein n=1 Tax=Tricholomella constricta TaxID=117010 RepID=A0A8H5M8V7_9AGAR|nr:hypothetical protein D9615_000898 [Tricholomella constricta]
MARKNICHQFSAAGTCTYGDRCKFFHAVVIPSSSRHSITYTPSSSTNTLDEFFDGYAYSGFSYDPNKPAWDEFHRMARFLHWGKEKKAEERESFKDALVQAFNGIYGTDENNLESWQTLCRVLSITPLPEGLEACREAVKRTYVNLVDLVDLPNSQSALMIFDTEAALSEYTLENHKIFPKENAYAGGLLKHLLRNIMNPRAVTRSRPQRRRRK